jgi:peptidoglycan/LPS O-acetylase OafA/YrhL
MSVEKPFLPAATQRFDTIDIPARVFDSRGYPAPHLAASKHGGSRHSASALPQTVARLLFFNGGNGVTAFFAISGVLITLTSRRRFGGLSGMRVGTLYRIRFA